MRVVLFVVVAVLILAGVGLSYFLAGQGTYQPGVDVSGRTAAAVPRHLKALQDGDAVSRKKAATALWLIGPEANEATPTLLVALRDPDDGVREAAARALGRTSADAAAAIAGLVAALQDKQADVRAAAAGALAETWVAEKSSGERAVGRSEKTAEIQC